MIRKESKIVDSFMTNSAFGFNYYIDFRERYITYRGKDLLLLDNTFNYKLLINERN